jgi:hypothetical protein
MYDKELKKINKKKNKNKEHRSISSLSVTIEKEKQAFQMFYQNLLGLSMIRSNENTSETEVLISTTHLENCCSDYYPQIVRNGIICKNNSKEESKKEINQETKSGSNEDTFNEETKTDVPEVDIPIHAPKQRIVEYIMVIGFHHHLGGQVRT